jgi:hypothetical protein
MEGPAVIQFSLNGVPYSMSKQPFYQLSTIHSCSTPTLIIDLGAQGDEHYHQWAPVLQFIQILTEKAHELLIRELDFIRRSQIMIFG